MAFEFDLTIFAFAAFLLIYWWRRRSRGGHLALSAGSKKLHELVESADKEIVVESLKGEEP